MKVISKNGLKEELRREVEKFNFDMVNMDVMFDEQRTFDFGNSIIDKMKDLTPAEFLDCFPLKKKSKRRGNRKEKYKECLKYIKSLDPTIPIGSIIIYFLFQFENETVNDFIEQIDLLWQDVLNVKNPKNLIEEFWIRKITNDEREDEGKRIINPHLRIIK